MGEIMSETEEFNTLAFEKKLMQLKDTQESIQSLSSWCLKQRDHHKKIVASWLNVLKRVKVEQRLTLFYLANDVIQYSKRKNYDFVESWGLYLQKATPLVRDEKVRPKILRILKIWEQRGVYDDEFLSDLTGLLSSGVLKKADDDPLDFQPNQLVNKIRQCTVLEADTDLRLQHIHASALPLHDTDLLATTLKDRSNKDDVEKELNEGIQCIERYTQALQREIVAREALLALLTTATQYYSTQRGEVKVVAYAYKNFGSRVRTLKRKLDELTPTLPPAPSPPRDEDVPSPGPDEDLDLPNAPGTPPTPDDHLSYNIDRTFNSSVSADGSLYNLGLASFLAADNPLALFNDSNDDNGNKIEVINSRPNEKQDFDINSFLKTLIPNDSNDVTADDTGRGDAGEPSLPGLGMVPPPSFYGTRDEPEPYRPEPEPYRPEPEQYRPEPKPYRAEPEQYRPESEAYRPESDTYRPDPEAYRAEQSAPWRGPAWSLPSLDTPESPPPAPPAPPPLVPLVPLVPAVQPYTAHSCTEASVGDVDHRGLLPPPPPPPVLPLPPMPMPLLAGIEDVDQRLLPALPQPVAPHARNALDVDHRNLISLTSMPRAPPCAPASVPAAVPAPKDTDQDYRLPPTAAPPDIVESVDMDLSEDEDQRMYSGPTETRRNNRVLVGGNGGFLYGGGGHERKEDDDPPPELDWCSAGASAGVGWRARGWPRGPPRPPRSWPPPRPQRFW